MARFIDGLRQDIKEKLHLQSISCLAKAVSIASTVEEDEALKQRRWSSRRSNWDKNASTTKRPTVEAPNKGQNLDTRERSKGKEVESKGSPSPLQKITIILITNPILESALGAAKRDTFLMIVPKERISQFQRDMRMKKLRNTPKKKSMWPNRMTEILSLV